MDPITLSSIKSIPEPFASNPSKALAPSGPGFGDLLKQAVGKVSEMR